MDTNKFDMLKLVSDLAERESDRTWGRTTAIITVNAGLFVLVSVAIQKGLGHLVLACAAVGILLAILWYCIAIISKHYETRWHRDMEAIVSADAELTDFVRGRNNPRTDRPKMRGKGRKRGTFSTFKLWVAIRELFGDLALCC